MIKTILEILVLIAISTIYLFIICACVVSGWVDKE